MKKLTRGERKEPAIELYLLVIVLLIATFFRFYASDRVPPGLSHDELRMMQLGELIVDGKRPIHWKISFSPEPFYMYLLALSMSVWGFTAFGARIVTRFLGIILIPVTYRLIRCIFGRRVALFTSAVLAVTWWPVFFSRVALRGMTLPVTLTIAVYCIWRGLAFDATSESGPSEGIQWAWYGVGSALIGFSWYTFTAARGISILLPCFIVYLAVIRQLRGWTFWKVLSFGVVVALIVAVPFIYEVNVRPGAAESRLDQLGGVIDKLKSGEIGPFLRQTTNALGVFLLRGDPNWRYNVSLRPAYGVLLGGLAVFGLILTVLRWKEPRYFLVLLWFLLGLAPSMLTPEAPSFVRAIGALPTAAVFPALVVDSLWSWAERNKKLWSPFALAVIVILLFAVNGLLTFRAMFSTWPEQPEVREIYQAVLTDVFEDINESSVEGRIWISEPFPDDRHIMLAERLLDPGATEVRWLNMDRALILPPHSGVRQYLVPDFSEPDPYLLNRWVEGKGSKEELDDDSGPYSFYQVEGGGWVGDRLEFVQGQSKAFADLQMEQKLVLPVKFGDVACLLGWELVGDRVGPGEEVYLIVYWRTEGPQYEPIASFAHLLDQESQVVGQYDGFDVPSWHWEPGEVVAQVYRFPITTEASSGKHWIEVGLYNSDTMERFPIVAGEKVVGDRAILLAMEVD